DEAAYADVHRALADEPLQITEFKSSRVVGTVDANHDGILYTSIPYEKGWTVKVDGVKAQVDPIQNAMIAFPITTGRHEVIMTYVPDGLMNGLLISLVSLVGFVVLFIHYERKPREKKIKQGKNAKTSKTPEKVEVNKVETQPTE
ncbi:MAG TPA: YfhO family protein, partial [Fusibacter sp.]|nr:YfhO family protein [Fusibacter sp.]